MSFLDRFRAAREDAAVGLPVRRAGSRPLPEGRQVQDVRAWFDGAYDLARQNKLKGCRPEDAKQVLVQMMDSNPVVSQLTWGPADVAAEIDVFPAEGIAYGSPRRADPEGSEIDRLAWMAWKRYRDDCGASRSLIRRHMAFKLGPGDAVQVRVDDPAGAYYEVVANDGRNVSKGRDGWVWHPRQGVDVPVDDARIVYRKASAAWAGEPGSQLCALVGLLRLEQLALDAIANSVEDSFLLGGVLIGPKDRGSNSAQWATEFFDWMAFLNEEGLPGIPAPLAVDDPAGFKFLSTAKDAQDWLLPLHEMIVEQLARWSPMDAGLVKDGIGSGTHWNGILQLRQNMQSFLWPWLRGEVLEDIATWPFRPAFQEALDRAGLAGQTNVDDWGLWGNWQRSINSPDQGDKIFESVKCGLLVPRALTDLGISDQYLLQPGTPEWDTFVARQEALGKGTSDEVPPSRQPVGVGGETFGSPPNPESDTSANPNPTQRGELVAAGGVDEWGWLPEWPTT